MSDEHCCKIDRISTIHEISPPTRTAKDLDTYLVDRWKGRENTDQAGVRTLSEWFNKQVLKSVYQEHGRSDSKVRIDADYAALQGDEIPDHERAELLSELSADGIDSELIINQFIGKSTMSRHLKKCLGKNKTTSDAETEWEIDQIQLAKNTFRSNLESALQSLDSKGRIAGVDEADIQIQATLSCPECPTRVTVETAYEQGYVCPDHHKD